MSSVIGLFSGLIVNYFADILPRFRRLRRPACAYCEHSRGWFDYWTLQRCRNCGRATAWRNAAVIFIFLGLGIATGIHPSARLGFWLGMLLLIFLGIVFVMDVEHRVVLEQVSVAGVVLCGGLGIYTHGVWMTLAGGAVGFGTMYLLYVAGVFYARWMAKRRGEETAEEGMGFGDVSLSGVLGLLLGFPGILAGLVAGILFGGVFSLALFIILKLFRKYSLFASIPYAPFLVFGAVVLVFFK